MASPVEFTVRFDGEAPGLQRHRLSLAAFHVALGKLLSALRHKLQAIASGDPNREHGRLGSLGKNFDLQLKQISDGCVTLTFDWGPSDEASDENDTGTALAERTVQGFLQDVEEEWSSPEKKSPHVYGFLRSLPEGVKTQEYEAKVGDRVIGKLKLDGTEGKQAQARRQLPRTRDFHGRVEAIRFHSENGRVRIRTSTGELLICRATAEIIDAAVELRHHVVVGKILIRQDLVRLLTIRSEGTNPSKLTEQEKRDYLFRNWDGTLRRLAE
jgi:hypothetical protein